jgi:DNA polymerase-3 subunit chi
MDVSFHTHVADVPAYAYRLLRKATTQGTRVLVVTQTPADLGRYLWSASATDFLPHLVIDVALEAPHPGPLEPIVLSSLPQPVLSGFIWLNLSTAWLEPSSACLRIIDIVADEPTQLQRGRQRWTQYARIGCNLTNHDARAHV